MRSSLAGKVALVAGASRGIGRTIVESLAERGAHVIALGRDAGRLTELADGIAAKGGACESVQVNLGDDEALLGALARLEERAIVPTILVHAAAAMYRHQRLHTIDLEEIDRFYRVDVRAAVILARWALPSMSRAGFGRVLFLGSLASRMGIPGGTLYAMDKAALEGLARGIALDYSRRGITSNVIMLGFVETERLRARFADQDGARQRLVDGTATKQIITPEEVADTVLFLASPSARSITGSVVELTGGAHLSVQF